MAKARVRQGCSSRVVVAGWRGLSIYGMGSGNFGWGAGRPSKSGKKGRFLEQTIAIACDHAGLDLKRCLADHLAGLGFQVLDLGTDGPGKVDYPDYAHALAEAIASGRTERGVLICGSGIGISMAANRHSGIRAALVHEVESARLARRHNDANVIAFGARFIEPETARTCLEAFLETEFEGGRHARRVAKLSPPVATRSSRKIA